VEGSPGGGRGATWELKVVEARFFGRFEHSLDSKGRVILPAKFRANFSQGGFLTQHHEGCLALWTPEQFDVQLKERQEKASSGRDDRNMARFWASSSTEMEMDRQGRMAIPVRLRVFAGLESDVLVSGAIDRVELWNPTRWEEKIGPEEQRLTEGSDN
jgi:MraZ protein